MDQGISATSFSGVSGISGHAGPAEPSAPGPEGAPPVTAGPESEDPVAVLGLDVGGTSSRALVATLDGEIQGAGEAQGGNPNSHPPAQAVAQIVEAVRAALGTRDPRSVRATVLGLAGVSVLSNPDIQQLFDQAWMELGLLSDTQSVVAVSDAEVAFSAGTSAPAGTVLIAGTGAVAARIEGFRLVATQGGWGWLLGDEGSGFWVGREAVRHTLGLLDRDFPREDFPQNAGPLASRVLQRILGTQGPGAPDEIPARAIPESREQRAQLRKQLISAVREQPPIQLAELAELVADAGNAGDSDALAIAQRAAEYLARTAGATRAPDDDTPVVLAGSLTLPSHPIGQALRAQLVSQGLSRGVAEPHPAGSGAAAAAWLAARNLVDSAQLTGLHERLVGPANGHR